MVIQAKKESKENGKEREKVLAQKMSIFIEESNECN